MNAPLPVLLAFALGAPLLRAQTPPPPDPAIYRNLDPEPAGIRLKPGQDVLEAKDLPRFEKPVKGWTAGFTGPGDWSGTRGFTESSKQTDKTGVGWFSVNGQNTYRGIRAPKGADYAVFEGHQSADHTQAGGPNIRRAAGAAEDVREVAASFDLTVCFADDGTPKSEGVLNCFLQIFEKTPEDPGYHPVWACFWREGRLIVGPWGKRGEEVPGVLLRRGQWYRLRIDASILPDSMSTVLSVWPVDAEGRQGRPQVSGRIVRIPVGLKHQGIARKFPAIAGAYTWGGRPPYSVATLICAYSQDDDESR